MIAEVRLDERLIHGQTMASWLSFLQATHILIASDTVAADPFQISALKMAVPSDYKLLIASTEKAANILQDERSAKLKMFVLCKTPSDVWNLIRQYPEIHEVNFAAYGQIIKAGVPNRITLIPGQLVVDQEDQQILRQIEALGISCVAQTVPVLSRKPISFI